MKKRSLQHLKAFSERAIEATVQAELISPLVYLPRKLRGHKARLTVDNLKISTDPATIAENHVRIADADPIGFLIAVMQGQPIPEFAIRPDGSVDVRYSIPKLDERIELAKWLGQKVTHNFNTKNHTRNPQRAEYDALIGNRLNAVQETAEED